MDLHPRDLGRGSAFGRLALARSARPGARRLYSYEWLENLAGSQMRNVTEIVPELQQLQKGTLSCCTDTRALARRSCCYRTSALVLGGPPNEKGSQATWGFYLLDGPDGSTRLLERGRDVAGKVLAEQLGFGPNLMDPIGFVMSKEMLRTIKRLAEDSGR